MKKHNLSGPAVFMYSVIVLVFGVSAVCFTLYYAGFTDSTVILWGGIVSFMILYHFGLRILFGEISKHFNINYNHPWYRKRSFEKALYKLLKVRKWKDKVLTFDPAAYDFKNRSLPELATTMSKSELDHWFNEIISVEFSIFGICHVALCEEVINCEYSNIIFFRKDSTCTGSIFALCAA